MRQRSGQIRVRSAVSSRFEHSSVLGTQETQGKLDLPRQWWPAAARALPTRRHPGSNRSPGSGPHRASPNSPLSPARWGPTSLGSPGRDAVPLSAARAGRESRAPSRGCRTRAVPARGVRPLGRDARVRVCTGWRHHHRPRVARASGADRIVRTVRRPADRSLRGEPRPPRRVPSAGCGDGRHGGLSAGRCATGKHVRSRCRDGDGADCDAPCPRRRVARDRTYDGAARCPECRHGMDPEHRSRRRACCRGLILAFSEPGACTQRERGVSSLPLCSWYRCGISYRRSPERLRTPGEGQ